MPASKRKRLLTAAAAAALLATLAMQAGNATPAPTPAPTPLTFPYNDREILSSRYTRPEPDSADPRPMDMEGFDPVFENGSLAVYIRKATVSLRVRDKASGYVWGCLPTDKPEDLNKTWAKLGNSLIAADIYDKDGNSKAYGTDDGNLAWTVAGNTLTGVVYWPELRVGLTFTMELAKEGLRFVMDGASVREDGPHTLGSVYFLPFFGSTREEEQPGYFLVPDGCGSLIRFSKARGYLQGFDKRIYGSDYGIDSLESIQGIASSRTGETMTEEESLSAPLFGVVHGAGRGAFYALVEDGGAYARLCVDPAGLITNYHRAHFKFIYRQTYEQPFNKTGAGIQTVQETPNTLKVAVTYRFLHDENADYVGIAKSYRDVLRGQGTLKAMTAPLTLPLQLDFLVADAQKEFIGTSVNKATSLEDIEDTVAWLAKNGVANIRLTLQGWQKGGWNGYKKTSTSTRTVYGGLSALGGLRNRLADEGGRLSLALAPLTARDGQADIRREIGISLSQSAIKKTAVDGVFRGDVWYLKPSTGLEALRSQAAALAAGGYGIVLDDIGYRLYGEYLQGKSITRGDALDAVTETAMELARTEKLDIVRPADYLYLHTRAYLSSPMVNSQYLFQTDTVPFLQIVLSGSMELVAPYANLSFFSGADLLKMIDYNCYPSFLLTGKDNYSLRKTASAGYRSTRLDDWKDYMAGAYGLATRILKPVMGQEITARDIPATGVSKTTYTDGIVYVNYNATPVNVDGIEIPGASTVFTDGTRMERGTVA